ncbi:MAG TPA: hypothetical protein VHB21_19740, partial [Minicystis sp.]|nr:hypothetical protein [Minicystis sp.]
GSGAGGTHTLSGDVATDTTVSGDVELTATATVLSGVKLTVAPGTTLHGAPGASLVVAGELDAIGTATGPIVFQSAADAGPGGWSGIVVDTGGEARLTHAEIREAVMAFSTKPSSSYALDYVTCDTSNQLMALASDGTVSHSTFHAFGMNQQGDPVTISSASPHVSDSTFDNANQYADHIAVSGSASSPQFDHLELSQAHCGFHFNQGIGITVSNSYMHDLAFAMMVEASLQTKVTLSNAENNQNNFGRCMGGDVTLSSDYVEGPPFDTYCTGQMDDTPANAPLSGVGPRP